MTDYDPGLVAELERLAPPSSASADWRDVLDRADVRTLPVRTVLVVALVAVSMLAAPALGVPGKVRQLLGIGSRPQVEFTAPLRPVTGSSGSGRFSATPLKAFTAIGSNRVVGFTQSVRFTLRLTGLSGPATSARLRISSPRTATRGESTVLLCRPCTATTTGVLRRRGIVLVLLTGGGTVEVATPAHPEGELRGRVLPRR